jgi:thiol:disulfide interchange protein
MKKKRFWGYPRLCLCLFFGLLLIFAIILRTKAADTVSTAGVVFASATPAKTILKSNVILTGTTVSDHKQTQQSLSAIFIAGFLGGMAALLMPCIFPMLPLTVSYFTQKSHSKKKAVNVAVLYGISIIVIYVLLGLLITVLFGSNALNSMSTNGIFNLFFFLLLVIFAASFLGAFEITLPSSWVNKIDQQSESRGIAGIFFMAATLSLVSFSCTGPIIGTLLVQAATTGALLGPATGMLGFSLALSIPFVLFAMFPSLLSSLPKSGGWLSSVKITLGFLELALALKFLSNVDLTYHWHWFDRELFLSLWIIIFGVMGIYLLGKLKLSHDSKQDGIGVFRLFLAIVTLSFTMYMIPGLWGAPLKSVAAFLPPEDTQDFDLYTPTLTSTTTTIQSNTTFPQQVRWSELFHAPLDLHAFFDYQQGIAYAKQAHKPVLIDFTGHACVNCRKMEATVWPDKHVMPLIRGEYVLIQLYVDDKTALPEAEEYTSKFSGQRIANIGAQNSDIQAEKFNSNSQPDYVLLDPETQQPLVPPEGAVYDPVAYSSYLQTGLTAYKNKRDDPVVGDNR